VCNFLSLCTAHTPCPIFVNLELLPPLPLENTDMSLPFTDNSTTLDPILNQKNLTYILKSYLLPIIILLSLLYVVHETDLFVSSCVIQISRTFPFICECLPSYLSHHTNNTQLTAETINSHWPVVLFLFNEILSLPTFSYINWPIVTPSVQDYINFQGNALRFSVDLITMSTVLH